ncbi:hypothetical protein DPX16_16714 [Anabarilius grahami]|uniref:Uncharacterized protein n=1 Tax=Anabarilius grahami TaxID=495550 RepID=A0A3N0YSB1_ANAGA|nr:hypothetical protein DPX16_16714 [Anabarilius grahami]
MPPTSMSAAERLIGLFQVGRSLERYVEEFAELAYLTNWSDARLQTHNGCPQTLTRQGSPHLQTRRGLPRLLTRRCSWTRPGDLHSGPLLSLHLHEVSRAPTPPPRCSIDGARRRLLGGGVMSQIPCLPDSISHNPPVSTPALTSLVFCPSTLITCTWTSSSALPILWTHSFHSLSILIVTLCYMETICKFVEHDLLLSGSPFTMGEVEEDLTITAQESLNIFREALCVSSLAQARAWHTMGPSILQPAILSALKPAGLRAPKSGGLSTS